MLLVFVDGIHFQHRAEEDKSISLTCALCPYPGADRVFEEAR